MKGLTKFSILLFFFCLISCAGFPDQEEGLAPPKTTGEIRLAYIKEQVDKNPVWALDLIGAYRKAYKVDNETGTAEVKTLFQMENDAAEKLKNFLDKAIGDEKWDEAFSYFRSLSAIGVQYEANEIDLLLAAAKKKLEEGNNL